MIRNVVTVLLTIAVSQAALAQTDSSTAKKFRHGISVGTVASGVPGYPYYFISYSIEKGRNRVSIGPVLGEKGGGYQRYSGGTNISLQNNSFVKGLSGVYQFFPNPSGKRYDLFFQYEATWQYFNYDRINTGSAIWITIPNYSSCWYVGQYVGYGLRVRFLKNFEITHIIGLGNLTGRYTVKGMNSISIGDKISGNTRLSLSYTFR
jgi:hypothetical protein